MPAAAAAVGFVQGKAPSLPDTRRTQASGNAVRGQL
jgi:hypothetical protein